MQEEVCKKYGITREELQEGVNELCAHGIGKGCYQKTAVLLALVDLLSNGDIPKE